MEFKNVWWHCGSDIDDHLIFRKDNSVVEYWTNIQKVNAELVSFHLGKHFELSIFNDEEGISVIKFPEEKFVFEKVLLFASVNDFMEQFYVEAFKVVNLFKDLPQELLFVVIVSEDWLLHCMKILWVLSYHVSKGLVT